MAEGNGDRVLRAKYNDYCSGRVADVLLSLSAEEVYALAEAEARADNRVAPSSHDEAVRLATRKIRDRLKLPRFREWAKEYLREPHRFDPHLMGLWKSESGTGARPSDGSDAEDDGTAKP